MLAVLKDDKKTDPERKREIEKLLGGISSEHFATLVVRLRLVMRNHVAKPFSPDSPKRAAAT